MSESSAAFRIGVDVGGTFTDVFAFDGDLEGTPVFFGCSDVDMHIPKERVVESAGVVESLNGAVDLRLYEGMGHTVNEDELDAVTTYVRDAVG